MAHILYIEDELDMAQLRLRILARSGYQVVALPGFHGVEAAVREHDFAAVLLDNKLHGSALDGLGILRWLQTNRPELPVIFISNKSEYHDVVTAVKGGAEDFLDKKDVPEILLAVLDRAVSRYEKRRRRERELLRRRGIFGQSPLMLALWQHVREATRDHRPVTLSGPAGTEKKQLAETIHQLTRPARRGEFVVVTCRGASHQSLSIELFGSPDHTESLRQRHVGKIESAAEGTLLLDQIDALPELIQGELLDQLRTVDTVRLVASTECGIEAAARRGKLRKELADYCATQEIRLPSLHERIAAARQDFADLCDFYVEAAGYDLGQRQLDLSDAARAALESYAWPHNLDELRDVIRRLYNRGRTAIDGEDVETVLRDPRRSAQGFGMLPYAQSKSTHEQLYFSDLSRICAGDWTRMTEMSGLTRDQLDYHLKKFSLR